jgi:hypothetical protein
MHLKNGLLAGVVVLVSMQSWGSPASGTITGVATDPSGKPIAEAKVRIRNQGTDAAREMTTDQQGAYAATLLPPGIYEVTVEAAAFRKEVLKNIKLDTAETVRLDVQLQIGSVTFTVEVSERTFLQRETSGQGQLVDNRKVTELALNERNFLSFALLAPGVQLPADGSQNSSEAGGGAVSVSGAREQANNFLLDGVDNNNTLLNQYSALPSIDAIEEFRVQATGSPAEFGRSGGGVINMTLKSGTNAPHGTLFEFFRNRHLDAKNYFDLPDCGPASASAVCGGKPKYNRNQFGGTLGGPIRKDKLFYFGSYEGLRLRQASTRQATVPSRAERDALLAAIPPFLRNPAGEAALKLYPFANTGTNLLTSNLYVAAPVIRGEHDQYLGKVDWIAGANDTVSAHYLLTDGDRLDPYAIIASFSNLPGFGTQKRDRGQNAKLQWTHAFSPTTLVESRFGFNRRRNGVLNENSGINRAKELGFPVIWDEAVNHGYPAIAVPGYDGLGESIVTPQDGKTATLQFAENMSWRPRWNGGRHQMKLGADVRWIRSESYLNLFARGQWLFLGITGPPLQDLLLGIPLLALAPSGTTEADFRTSAWNFYWQDDVRVSDRLTLNVGLRYEYNRPPVDAQDRLSVPDLGRSQCSPQPNCLFLRAGSAGVPRATFNSDWNNVAPRIGLAWTPGRTSRFVVRSSYGVFYDTTLLNRSIFARINPPFFSINVYLNNGANNIQNIVSGASLPQPPQVGLIERDARESYMQNWNAGVQVEAARNLVFDLSYVGSKGTNLVRQRDMNQPRPGGPKPYPQFGASRLIASDAHSTYHSLQMKAERRWAKSVAFLASYAFSKAIDNASSLIGTNSEPAFPQDSFDAAAERGLSNFHAKHRFVLSLQQELPWGANHKWLRGPGVARAMFGDWQLNVIWGMNSGRPFTVNRGVDQSGTGTDLAFKDRPDAVGNPFAAGPVANHPDAACRATASQGGKAADRVRAPESWFNPCAFAAPAAQRFGNSGRNNLIGPGLQNVDLSLLKIVPMPRESHRLQVRFEVFNLANHPNFDTPNRVFDSAAFVAVQSANASGLKPPRQIQIGLRYVF